MSAEDFRSRQWHLDAMSAEELWGVSTGKGVIIAVIDSGVDPVPELQGSVVDEKNFAGERPLRGNVGRGHGTEMASLIAGTGRSGGVKGLAPDAKIMSLKTGYADLTIGAPTDVWIQAIEYAVDHGARIINMSQTATGLNDARMRSLQAAVDYARNKGVLVFAGSGNDGKDGSPVGYPSSYPGVVGVAAVDQSGKVADFSTYGPQVKLAAPGVGIPGRCKNGQGFCAQDGTSHATALASASAALIWSKHPTWTNNQVLRVMMQTASKPEGKVPSKYIGYGIIRPGQVLIDGKGDPGDPDVNPLLPNKKQAEPSRQPSSEPSASSPGIGKNSDSEDARRAAEGLASSGGEGGGPSRLWPVLGAGAGVVAIGAAVFFLRRRTSRSSP
ncbi:S8 family serine peptidase [Streptomyces zagrosensis]|uniref:Type VII secretion-associated serine protease mycosin n=1 Tax=Streptomyces zagrosensis TaxID=1042984 RepID=A0A7W9V2K2_9ACTN|nr:S8 family serine peptidase [Streptomyces zagrosensis]MBB5940037.1 type VII secretion-associated serine protease mycosin [Streptomyces zagrosensis]